MYALKLASFHTFLRLEQSSLEWMYRLEKVGLWCSEWHSWLELEGHGGWVTLRGSEQFSTKVTMLSLTDMPGIPMTRTLSNSTWAATYLGQPVRPVKKWCTVQQGYLPLVQDNHMHGRSWRRMPGVLARVLKLFQISPKFDRCEKLFTFLDFGPKIQNLIIPISTIFTYQNRSISFFSNS